MEGWIDDLPMPSRCLDQNETKENSLLVTVRWRAVLTFARVKPRVFAFSHFLAHMEFTRFWLLFSFSPSFSAENTQQPAAAVLAWRRPEFTKRHRRIWYRPPQSRAILRLLYRTKETDNFLIITRSALRLLLDYEFTACCCVLIRVFPSR